MNTVVLVARLGLAGVFAVAAIAKLADRRAFEATLHTFGLPRRLSAASVLVLPLAELGLAVLLVPASTARVAAIAGLVMLAIFTGAITRSLVRGQWRGCGCFGQAGSRGSGLRALVRNAVLAAVAALVAIAGSGRTISDAAGGIDLLAVCVVLAGALVVQTWFVVQVLRRHGRLLARLRALETGPPPRPPEIATIDVVRVRGDAEHVTLAAR